MSLYEDLINELALPEGFLEVLRPALEELGYEVKLCDDLWEEVFVLKLRHYRIGANGQSVALLHVTKDVIKFSDGIPAINSVVEYFIKDVIGVFCFSETNEIAMDYENQANLWMRRYPNIQTAKFIKLEVIDRLKKLGPDGRSVFLNNSLILSRLFPVVLASSATVARTSGPPFELHVENVDLQGLFGKELPFIDVGTIQGAMPNVNSVCLIKINKKPMGTGFLVGDDLVLTNHHVMSNLFRATEEQITRNAAKTTLHFGYVAHVKGVSMEEQTFELDPKELIVAKDAQLDFALLRVEPRIKEAKNLRKVTFAAEAASEQDALHMLQHPGGQVMQLALSDNSVIYISEDGTNLQYATRTAGGSSGSPCFNNNWEVVALHRSEETREFLGVIQFRPVFGTVRNGTPVKSIHEKIKGLLGNSTDNAER